MFVRFRQTPNRLQVSLIETRRVDGKVRHQHVATLGSIPVPPSISDRLTFWTELHGRIARLANRISADDQHKIMAAIYDRVPMVATDEQRQRENAEHDMNTWSALRDMNEATLAEHKAFAAQLAQKIADLEAATAASAANADAARERLAKIDRRGRCPAGLASQHPSTISCVLPGTLPATSAMSASSAS